MCKIWNHKSKKIIQFQESKKKKKKKKNIHNICQQTLIKDIWSTTQQVYIMGLTQSTLLAPSSLNVELTMSYILSARPHTRKEIIE